MMIFGRRTIILLVTAIAAALLAGMNAQLILPQMGIANIKGLKDPRLVIRKSARSVEVYDGPKLVRSFRMVLGFSPELDKEVEGDGRTPEGEFHVFTKNPKSRFHLSLGLSYPAPDDAERGFAGGLITSEERTAILTASDKKSMPPQKTALGGEIYIHGGGTANDWTDGCIALNNDEMTELFEAVPIGTKVNIVR